MMCKFRPHFRPKETIQFRPIIPPPPHKLIDTPWKNLKHLDNYMIKLDKSRLDLSKIHANKTSR